MFSLPPQGLVTDKGHPIAGDMLGFVNMHSPGKTPYRRQLYLNPQA